MYTKGEWKWRRVIQDEIWIMCGDLVIATIHIADNSEEANARLIAQAPRLYEFVKEMAEQSVPGAGSLIAEVEK